MNENNRGKKTMGFEMTVVETDVNINLSDMYRVKEAVEDAFDWYLGTDIKAKLDKFIALQTKARNLTYDEVLTALNEKFGEDSNEVKMFKSVHKLDVAEYLKMLYNAIGDFREDNSHLFFDWEKLPGKDITFSCSYNLYELIFDAAMRVYKNDVAEISLDKLKHILDKLTSKSFKFKMTKWIGYFFPGVAERMVRDMCEELGIDRDYWIEVNDLIYYRDELAKIVKDVNPEKRLWVVSSY